MTASMEVTTWLKLCCFVDFFAVALVVPQMSAYFTSAGVSSDYYGFIMSVYYFSQIIGGVVMGSLSDVISRRDILIISFLGSAVSYAAVGLSSDLYVLFGSRIVVGLVKQTMSISTAIMSSLCADPLVRAKQIGHISATVTLAFILGPSVGSILYGMDPSYPAVVASVLFLINVVLCLVTIPKSIGTGKPASPSSSLSSVKEQSSVSSSFVQDVKDLAQHGSVLAAPLFSLVLIVFVERSMSYSNILSYFEIRYNMNTKNVGFVSSLSSLFAFIANTSLVSPFISLCGDGNKERAMVCALILCASASFLEVLCKDIYHYVVLVVPLSLVSSSIVMTLSKSVLSCSVPHEHVGKTLAVYGVLESVVGVIAPLYGTHFFTQLGYCSRGWLAGVHYVVAAIFLWAALVRGHQHDTKKNVPTDSSVKKDN